MRCETATVTNKQGIEPKVFICLARVFENSVDMMSALFWFGVLKDLGEMSSARLGKEHSKNVGKILSRG